MDGIVGKKILILGGANQHVKYVEAAKEMGVFTIVTDFLDVSCSPAKQIADEHWELSIMDIDGIVKRCQERGVDGVIAGHLDPCQIPYEKICHRLNKPCYATADQFFKFTNKAAFKSVCKSCGVGVVDDYSEEDIALGNVKFPVFVKPVDSRGSRGQTVCYSFDEIPDAIALAKMESSNGQVLIERFMGDAEEFQITYFVVDKKVYVLRTADSKHGSSRYNLQNVVNCAISPSVHTNDYFIKVHSRVLKMIDCLGIQFGPLFMQGFYDEGEFYFFDPGLRFPGVEYERITERVFGINFPEILCSFALSGIVPTISIPDEYLLLKDKMAVLLYPVVRAGKISKIKGLNDFLEDSRVVSCTRRYSEGDIVGKTDTVNQRFLEVDLLCQDSGDAKEVIERFQQSVSVLDEYGNEMLFDEFDVSQLDKYNKPSMNSGLSVRFISEENVKEIYKHNPDIFYDIVEDAFNKYNNGEVLLPNKISQIFDANTQNRINCMPATLLKDKVSGLKWVSVFPTNAIKGLNNVSGLLLLSEIDTGFPLAVIDGTLLTSIRTAAVGCVAARYLAPSRVERVGFIGGGVEARMHFILLKHMFPSIKECRVSSRTASTEQAFIDAFSNIVPNVHFIACKGDTHRCVEGADIIITAISGQVPILKAKDINKGCLYIHVGGWEDEFAVVDKADKIICDEWESCKHRTQTISRMFVQGLLKDDDIYADLKDIISGKVKGRENDNEFIYFNSVGLSFIDLNFANETYKLSIEKKVGKDLVLCKNTFFDYGIFV